MFSNAECFNVRFYITIPPLPTATGARTFIVLPPKTSPSFSHFSPTQNNLAPDEVQAHTGMFEPQLNDGYYELGLQSARVIIDSLALANKRGMELSYRIHYLDMACK
jgi:hypothetical protein